MFLGIGMAFGTLTLANLLGRSIVSVALSLSPQDSTHATRAVHPSAAV
jgi:hypothetical protein